MEDVAEVIKRVKEYQFFGITEKSKWVLNAVGESATVALWIKAKHPKLLDGAIISSPVEFKPITSKPLVEAYHVFASGGSECVKSLEVVLKEFRKEAEKGRDSALFK